MRQRIAASDGSGRYFEFVPAGEECADLLHLVELPLPKPARWRHARCRGRKGHFSRRYREYRRRAEEE
jgi:hypothetical protein